MYQQLKKPPASVKRSISAITKPLVSVNRSVSANDFDNNGIWITPPAYEFLPNPRITLLQMYKLINFAGTYHQLPDNMKKLHPFIFEASHIQSTIDRTYMDVLVDARVKRNMHYSKEN